MTKSSVATQVRAALAAYLSDPTQLGLTTDLAVLARSLEALPVYADLGGALLIRPSGEVLLVHSDQPWDATSKFEVEARPEWRRLAFEACSRRFPALDDVMRHLLDEDDR